MVIGKVGGGARQRIAHEDDIFGVNKLLNANQEAASIGNTSNQFNHGLQNMDQQHHIPLDPMLHQSDEVHDINLEDLA